jgi:hypothetical protein
LVDRSETKPVITIFDDVVVNPEQYSISNLEEFPDQIPVDNKI